ncbi:MAG: Rab subfamily of small GTPase [Marteilia pararefringens]
MSVVGNPNQIAFRQIYKIVIVGQSGVGKTQLVSRFAGEGFNNAPLATVGVDFKSIYHEVKGLDPSGEVISIKAQLWDTAGQERFNKLSNAYFKGAKGTFVVYDITSEDSIKKLEEHVRSIRDYADPNTVIFVLGNKTDLHSLRRVDKEEVEAFCKNHGVYHFETSARNSENTEEVIRFMINKIYETFPETTIKKPNRHPNFGSYSNIENSGDNSNQCCWSSLF